MGFLQAVSSLGTLDIKEGQEDYISFLEPPFEQKETKSPNYVIQIGLKVKDKNADILSVLGIASIDCIAYPGMKPDDILQTYLYKSTTGNVSQSYTPLFRLGKPENSKIEFVSHVDKKKSKSALKDEDSNIFFEKGNWKSDKDSRFFKIRKTVLQNYENEHIFENGNTDLIMNELENNVDRLIECWSEKKSSYIMVFGIDDNGRFLYPGEINAFLSYFKNKIASMMGEGTAEIKSKEKNSVKKTNPVFEHCSLCDSETTQKNTLDKLFPFATFDKESFLPGTKDKNGADKKVFPICSDCSIQIVAGIRKMESTFKDMRVVPGYILYVIPELIGAGEKLETASSKTQDFLKTGIKTEERTFKNLLKADEYLVYHFLFIEENQAQQRIHFMIEDVPPSRIKKLQNQWKGACKSWERSEKQNDDNKSTEPGNRLDEFSLDYAFQQIYYMFRDLAGKSEQEQKFMREEALQVIAKLLNQEYIETKRIKTVMVSRLPGLFANPEWIVPKVKMMKHGKTKMIEMARILDFITRSNQTKGNENEIGLDE